MEKKEKDKEGEQNETESKFSLLFIVFIFLNRQYLSVTEKSKSTKAYGKMCPLPPGVLSEIFCAQTSKQ